MYDYDKADHPWKEVEKYITNLTVADDLKYIGNEAFADLVNLQYVYFRGNVEEFGKDIFWNCPTNMYIFLIVGSEDELTQNNPTYLKLSNCLKGTGNGCYRLYEGEPEDAQEETADIEICTEGDTCEEGYLSDTSDGDQNMEYTPDHISPVTSYLSSDAECINVLNNKKTGEIITVQDFKGLSCCAYYTGKKIKFDIKCDGLKPKKDYKVSYKNNRSVGQAHIIIKGKGDYNGTINAYFNIKPTGTSLKYVKAQKKGIKIKWKKQNAKMSKKHITGYQIQLATDRYFTKNLKTIRVKSYKKSFKRVKNLKANKKYYVRICTYVKKSSGSTYYSRWSKFKTAKTKA